MPTRALTKILVVLLPALLPGAASQARASVIFDSFGPGDTYVVGMGWTVSGAASGARVDSTVASAFTVSGGDYLLSSIEVAIGLVSGPDAFTLLLCADAGGTPGQVLEGFGVFDAMGPFGSANPPVRVDSGFPTLLTAGSTYWLVASVLDSGTWAAWNWNSLGIEGPLAASTDGVNFSPFVARLPAFRVVGVAVPEPSGLALAGVGGLALLGLAGMRRPRRAD